MANPQGINQYTKSVRTKSAAANKRAKVLAQQDGGLAKLREGFKSTSRYQAASALKSARKGGHWAQPKLMSKAIKEAASAQAYRNEMRKRGMEITGGASSYLTIKPRKSK
jgi:hypothetical protein